MAPTQRGQGSAQSSESPSSAATSGAIHFLENVPFAAIFVSDVSLVPIPNAAARTLLRIDAPTGNPSSSILQLLGADATRLATGAPIRWDATIGGEPRLQLVVTASPFRDPSGARVGSLLSALDVTDDRDATDLQGSFVSTVAHELRTPLAALRGFMDNLRDGIEGPLNAGQRECVLRMQRISDRLVGLLDGLLKLSKLQSGMAPCRVDQTDVAGIVGESVLPFQREATERGLRLNTLVAASLPAIHSDGDRIIQVLTNLVSNAIKHTPRGGQVTVRATPIREATVRAIERLGSASTLAGRISDWIQISVEDDGEGISGDEIDRIFDPFYQSSRPGDREGTEPGVGLGLAICKEILRGLQGHIFVESTLGKGTTFTFVLPLRLQPATAPNPSGAASPAATGKENAHV
jgi:two-component system, NtrC family, sensor histidine kinase KinB